MSLTVRAVYDGNATGGEATWIVGLVTFEKHVADQFDRRVFVTVDSGLTAAESRAALDAAQRARGDRQRVARPVRQRRFVSH